MNPNQLQKFLKNHALTTSGLAEILGVTNGAVNHWVNGVRSVPVPVQRILKLFDKHPDLMEEF